MIQWHNRQLGFPEALLSLPFSRFIFPSILDLVPRIPPATILLYTVCISQEKSGRPTRITGAAGGPRCERAPAAVTLSSRGRS